MSQLTTRHGMADKRMGWVLLALVLALVGTAGSLLLSLGLGLKACPLCFYQRSFVMGVFAILAVGLAVDRLQASLYSLLVLPLAIAGLGIAAFHEYLVLTDALECPLGLFAMGTAPAQSLALFACLSLVLLGGSLRGSTNGNRRAAATLGASVLGLLLAWGSVASSPPMPPAPTAPMIRPSSRWRCADRRTGLSHDAGMSDIKTWKAMPAWKLARSPPCPKTQAAPLDE